MLKKKKSEIFFDVDEFVSFKLPLTLDNRSWVLWQGLRTEQTWKTSKFNRWIHYVHTFIVRGRRQNSRFDRRNWIRPFYIIRLKTGLPHNLLSGHWSLCRKTNTVYNLYNLLQGARSHVIPSRHASDMSVRVSGNPSSQAPSVAWRTT